jgi:hypothetical protein
LKQTLGGSLAKIIQTYRATHVPKNAAPLPNPSASDSESGSSTKKKPQIVTQKEDDVRRMTREAKGNALARFNQPVSKFGAVKNKFRKNNAAAVVPTGLGE